MEVTKQPTSNLEYRTPNIMFEFTPALILTFSLGEKEQRACGAAISADGPTNPAAGFPAGRRRIHPLLGERAGVREDKPSVLMLRTLHGSEHDGCFGGWLISLLLLLPLPAASQVTPTMHIQETVSAYADIDPDQPGWERKFIFGIENNSPGEDSRYNLISFSLTSFATTNDIYGIALGGDFSSWTKVWSLSASSSWILTFTPGIEPLASDGEDNNMFPLGPDLLLHPAPLPAPGYQRRHGDGGWLRAGRPHPLHAGGFGAARAGAGTAGGKRAGRWRQRLGADGHESGVGLWLHGGGEHQPAGVDQRGHVLGHQHQPAGAAAAGHQLARAVLPPFLSVAASRQSAAN